MNDFYIFPNSNDGDYSKKRENYLEFLSNLPFYDNKTQIKKAECSETSVIFRTSMDSLNDFLFEKFDGLTVFGFLEEYMLLYIHAIIPISLAPNIICLFDTLKKGNKSDIQVRIELGEKLTNFMSNPLDFVNYGPLHLHDSNISTFRLIRSDLDLEKYALPNGFVYSIKDFTFFLSSSSQGDMTVVYNSKKELEP